MNAKYEVGMHASFKLGSDTTFGRIEKINHTGHGMILTISDGQHLYDVSSEAIIDIEDKVKVKHDPVNHPSHYTDGKIEVIDFINDKNLNFNRGNVIKYVSRAGKKSSKGLDDKQKEIQDLEKAAFYLNDEIKRLKEKIK